MVTWNTQAKWERYEINFMNFKYRFPQPLLYSHCPASYPHCLSEQKANKQAIIKLYVYQKRLLSFKRHGSRSFLLIMPFPILKSVACNHIRIKTRIVVKCNPKFVMQIKLNSVKAKRIVLFWETSHGFKDQVDVSLWRSQYLEPF